MGAQAITRYVIESQGDRWIVEREGERIATCNRKWEARAEALKAADRNRETATIVCRVDGIETEEGNR